jgi:hypothetical protein
VQLTKVTAAAIVLTSEFGFLRKKLAGRIQACEWAKNQQQRGVGNACENQKGQILELDCFMDGTMIAGEERWTVDSLKMGQHR